MDNRNEVREFLTSRRARIAPEQSGLPIVGGNRRVAGLRREEVAMLRDRTDLGVEFGATDVVPERGEEGIAAVRELTGGDGTHVVLECVGHRPAYDMAVGAVRAGGTISRVGVPQYEDAPVGFGSLLGRLSQP